MAQGEVQSRVLERPLRHIIGVIWIETRVVMEVNFVPFGGPFDLISTIKQSLVTPARKTSEGELPRGNREITGDALESRSYHTGRDSSEEKRREEEEEKKKKKKKKKRWMTAVPCAQRLWSGSDMARAATAMSARPASLVSGSSATIAGVASARPNRKSSSSPRYIRAMGDYTKTVSDFSIFPAEAAEGKNGLYWYHEDTGAFFDDSDHYKMIKAMCRLSCSVCDKEDQTSEGPKRRRKFRNIDQLKGHLYHGHRLFMCNLCLEGRKIFICEQKLYNRSQLSRHINSGDSEVDGDESERGGFMGHPLCEFCRKPFYGDNELYSHMSTEHYTCHICQRQNTGQYEYYKDYDDLETHFRQQHFLCEDEACLAKKFIVFVSESEMKRHNALEHGGNMSRAKRNAALQIPTSFRYRPINNEDHHRGRRRGSRLDSSDPQLTAAIEASLTSSPMDYPSISEAHETQSGSDHRGTSDDEIVAPLESLTTADLEATARYRQALGGTARNAALQESSFPPLAMAPPTSQQGPRHDSNGLGNSSMAARLRSRNKGKVNVINSAQAWPAASQGSASTSGLAQSRPTATHGLVPTSSSAVSSQSRPVVTSASPPISYASSAQSRPATGNGHVSNSSSSLHWSSTSNNTRVSHSASAPNLIERGYVDSSKSDFPPISAKKENGSSTTSAPSQKQVIPVEDVHTANKSLVETIRSALEFDENKFVAFKDISAEYRNGLINAGEYLSYVQQFGLSHLVLDLARLCPNAQKQRDLIETYNASVKFRRTGEIDSGYNVGNKKVDKSSKKGKGKLVEGKENSSKESLSDSILSTVRKLQASHKPSEEEVETLSKDGYRSSKGKSKVAVDERRQELASSNGAKTDSVHHGIPPLVGANSNQNSGGATSGGKLKKKMSKFHRVRLGDGSAAALLDLRQGDPNTELEEESTNSKQTPSGTTPVRGAWRNGGGQRLVTMTQKDPAK
ncbi:hypothetical protein Sjap_007170 [Stephania japonica]|uniref:C2H2-type domain-containing protein n=1 Tax=Stephania japonica TaxID=461633 RepID=A0AAP0JN25_9MAGN